MSIILILSAMSLAQYQIGPIAKEPRRDRTSSCATRSYTTRTRAVYPESLQTWSGKLHPRDSEGSDLELDRYLADRRRRGPAGPGGHGSGHL
jgi:hypothetical protein